MLDPGRERYSLFRYVLKPVMVEGSSVEAAESLDRPLSFSFHGINAATSSA